MYNMASSTGGLAFSPGATQAGALRVYWVTREARAQARVLASANFSQAASPLRWRLLYHFVAFSYHAHSISIQDTSILKSKPCLRFAKLQIFDVPIFQFWRPGPGTEEAR